MKRFLPILMTLALSVVFVPAALADGSTSSPSSITTSTPATTTDIAPSSTTTTTTTDVAPPATTTTTTDAAPPTTTTTTTDAAPPTTTTTTTDGSPTTTATISDDLLPSDVVEACTDATCIPVEAAGINPGLAAGTGTAGALPFTGIADMVAPVLLALTVLLGGVVAWRWAQLRESVARDADVAIETPARTKHSGYQRALRMQEIDARARAVFATRVA